MFCPDKRPTCSEPSLQLSVSERSAVSSCFNLTHSCTDPTSTGLTYVLTNTSLGGGDQPLLAFFSLGTNSQGSQLSYLSVCLEANITGLPGRYMVGPTISHSGVWERLVFTHCCGRTSSTSSNMFFHV